MRGKIIMKKNNTATIKIHHAHLWGMREDKYRILSKTDMTETEWETLKPQSPFYLFIPQDVRLLKEYEKWQRISDIMPVNSVGIVTARDHLTIHWSRENAWETVQDFASLPEEKAREKYQLGEDAQDWKVKLARQDLGDSGLEIKFLAPVLYRPFDTRWTYYTGKSRGFICRPRSEVMGHILAGKNLGICIGRAGQVIGEEEWDIIFPTKFITEFNMYRRGGNVLFPLYIYPSPDEAGIFVKRPNFSQEFVEEISHCLQLCFIHDGKGDLRKTFGPEDAFHYMYAVFHSPEYRSRYAEFLKMDFPRLPLTGNLDLFRSLTSIGGELVALHLMESTRLDKHITKFIGDIPSGEIEKITYSGETIFIDKAKSQGFRGVPEEVWNFHIGGYQVCEKWLKDRKGRRLSEEEIDHYQRIVVALKETIRLMGEIDEVIEKYGGFPGAFVV
jgi:predicted helicase